PRRGCTASLAPGQALDRTRTRPSAAPAAATVLRWGPCPRHTTLPGGWVGWCTRASSPRSRHGGTGYGDRDKRGRSCYRRWAEPGAIPEVLREAAAVPRCHP